MRRVTLAALLGVVAVLTFGVQAQATPPPAGTVQNPGFEADGTGVATPTGWRDIGVDGASYTELGGYDGSYRLSHWSPSPYAVTTVQTVDVRRGGSYTLGIWARSGGGKNLSAVSLTCGGLPQSTVVPVSNNWLHLVVSAPALAGRCTIALSSVADGGAW